MFIWGCGHNVGLRKEKKQSMYTKQQEKIAFKEFERTGSVSATIQRLGYPSRATLYRWFEDQKAGIENWHGLSKPTEYTLNKTHFCNTATHPRHPSADVKMDALRRCFELGEDVEYVSRDIGYSRASIYIWRRLYLEKGAAILMPSKKNIPRAPLVFKQSSEPSTPESAASLQKQINNLQLEVDVLKETIHVLKKDPGADMAKLSNPEKAVVVSALKDKYALPLLLYELDLPKSSYYYQLSAMARCDKYARLRIQIKEIFHENRACYGYRRVWRKLNRQGIIVSEKIVRRLMKEDALVVCFIKQRKYNSYQGELSPEVDNIINRDFHSVAPNTKWLTDITEFALPAGKVYLSPILDCFDGLVVSWTLGTSPKAELVNTMLDTAISGLKDGQTPIVHTDRGCHYRWPGWIELMDKAGLIRSMSKKGCSPDNAACEGFFGRLKNEMFYGKSWIGISIDQFIEQVNRYIQWYNEKRIKISLGAMSPVEYRRNLGLSA